MAVGVSRESSGGKEGKAWGQTEETHRRIWLLWFKRIHVRHRMADLLGIEDGSTTLGEAEEVAGVTGGKNYVLGAHRNVQALELSGNSGVGLVWCTASRHK